MAESDDGKASARRGVKKGVAKGDTQAEASAVAETVSASDEGRQAQVRERLQQMGVLREPGNPDDAAKNNNTTTGAAKMASANRKEQNKDKSFWTQILIGLAVVVSLFLFIRSIAHHAPEQMAQHAAGTSEQSAAAASAQQAASTAPADSTAQPAAAPSVEQQASSSQPSTQGAADHSAAEKKPANGWLGALFAGKEKEETDESHAAEGAGESGQAASAHPAGAAHQQAGQEQAPAWAQPRLERIDALREQIRSEMRALQDEERKRMDEQRKAEMPVWMRGHVERLEVLREEMRKEMDAMHRSFREHGMEQGAPNQAMPMPQGQPAAPAQDRVAPPRYYQGPGPWGYPYPPQGGNR